MIDVLLFVAAFCALASFLLLLLTYYCIQETLLHNFSKKLLLPFFSFFLMFHQRSTHLRDQKGVIGGLYIASRKKSLNCDYNQSIIIDHRQSIHHFDVLLLLLLVCYYHHMCYMILIHRYYISSIFIVVSS